MSYLEAAGAVLAGLGVCALFVALIRQAAFNQYRKQRRARDQARPQGEAKAWWL